MRTGTYGIEEQGRIAPISVELVDVLGSDVNIVNAARVSFAKEVQEVGEADQKLMRYLWKHKHWTPFAHTCITVRCKAPIFLARQLVKHQVGLCLSADTEITFVKHANGASNGTYKQTLADIANMWFGKVKYQGGAKGKRNITVRNVRVYDETTQRFAIGHISDVIDSGIKDVYRVTDEYGHSIKTTADHQLLTQRGWVACADIFPGDMLIRSDVGATFGQTPLARCDSEDVITRRNYRASVQAVSNCANCGAQHTKDNLEVDHIRPVRDGGSHASDNLQMLCVPCHKVKTAQELAGKRSTTLLPKYTSVVSVEFIGKEQCYDISIPKYHNFIGNGFVVHNCWNEESRRYIDTKPEYYIPESLHIAPTNAKQGAGTAFTEVEYKAKIDRLIQNTDECDDMYLNSIRGGMAPEEARMFLPLNTHTNWVWSGSLVAFMRVIEQRSDSHAQGAAQEFAKLLRDAISGTYPMAIAAYNEVHNGCN